jgi:hypothetical protein
LLGGEERTKIKPRRINRCAARIRHANNRKRDAITLA